MVEKEPLEGNATGTLRAVLKSQYHAALAMLRNAIRASSTSGVQERPGG